MLEKDIENIIVRYPDEIFPNEGFELIGQQVPLLGKRLDILFKDKFNRKIIIEVKRGILTREASGQIAEYYGLLKSIDESQNIELILCANIIPNERKYFLETIGISCKEISEERIRTILEKYRIETKIESNTEITSTKDLEVATDTEKHNTKTMNDLYNHIEIMNGREIINAIINGFQQNRKYYGEIENKTVLHSYAIRRKEDNESKYDYAFIVNKLSILFYIRKPGEKWLNENNKLEKIRNSFKFEKTNKANEITIRLEDIDETRKLMDMIFI